MAEQSKCVYCGNPPETKDHIPSKNLIRAEKDPKLITVPSCLSCNNSFSKDEEYFRNLITSLRYEESLTATNLFDTAVSRSIRARPALARKMFKNMTKVDLYSKGGIYLGKKTAIKMTKEDHRRVFNVLDKYIKGLFFYHFQKILPSDWVIRHGWLVPRLESKVKHLLKDMRREAVQEHIFIYGFNSVSETHQSVWCLVFFGKPLFFSYVIDPDTARKFEKKNDL